MHLRVLNSENKEGIQKFLRVAQLSPEIVAAIGNGKNNLETLQKNWVIFAVIGQEEAAVDTLLSATIIVHKIINALHLLLNPQMLKGEDLHVR